jgi:hypothetical protein
MQDYPKRIKRQLRELATIAYERELRRHLSELEADFGQWRAGSLDCWAMSDRIHRFHDGPSRRLFSYYTSIQPNMVVAQAIASNLLQESEVPEEVLQAIAGLVEMHRSWEQASAEKSE